ncbi:ribonuclease T2 [Litoreibacter ascidiaceicola]|uniref:Ribonuclease T2 n=1 Tax=Litoreibacter ascidiaceicola TaxID=1486859 RepID=A0A1M5CC05_9RHOB|nr:ribonuclease T2 [Litoreibacter ascidiaceicola]SHF52230.1 ribonuclease T2 [Litoreibacter ascidiaceicola]
MRILLLGLLIWGAPLWAEEERAGKFDYYVLSLSWSPTWCALEGDARGADQCDDRHDFGWTLHGLWPQNERGWPSYCRTVERDPSRGQTKAMADIMGSGGLAWHQWKKHGRCSGLSSDAYFEISRRAYASLTRPAVFRNLEKPVKLPAKVVEEAFLESNPRLSPDMITITCKNRRIQEVRLCLNKDLEPRICGEDVVGDCSIKDALFDPIR